MIAHRSEIIAEIERRRFDLNVGLLRIYNFYRTFVGIALLVAVAQDFFSTSLGILAPELFQALAGIYTIINIVSTAVLQIVPRQWFARNYLALGLVLFDIVSLTTLMYCSGGIGSGFAPLILITVVTGAILLTGRPATFVAAAASVALLYEEFYLSLSPEINHDFFQAGVFGIIYFIASLSVQTLSNRIRSNDIRALTQAAELADLERLNRLIIQRMRTGIIVVDQDNQVRMFNQSARALVGEPTDSAFSQLPEQLAQRLNAWRQDMSLRAPPFRVQPNAPELRANFSAVRSADAAGDVTVFLEDTGEVQQQAQQLKLAELGRLSASIAHEVRNPLGAISHAAQLLVESDELAEPDKRLTDIIISHCQRMNGVVENVLEMSRRRTPSPQRLSLQQYLEQFVGDFLATRPGAQVNITVEPTDTKVRVDPAQLNQALNNLIENGLRYSKEHKQIERVDLVAGLDIASERPYLNVIDFGQGVPQEQIDKLFQPFETTSVKGTGLGLYISRELCEANQAQLSYFRHEQGGSVFRILFAHPDRITV